MGLFTEGIEEQKELESKYLKVKFDFIEAQFEKLLVEQEKQKKEMETLKVRVGVLESKIKRLIFNSDD